jgi:hypothetical protein
VWKELTSFSTQIGRLASLTSPKLGITLERKKDLMVDFTQLLRKPAGEAKKPPPLPAGDYPAIIKSFELGDNNKNKTPYVRFQIGLMDFPGTVDQADRADIDLSKRQMRRDYYLTEDALWRLDELIRGAGVAPGRSYEETLPEMVGLQLVASVKQEMNQQTNEVFATIDKLTGHSS